jgi:hypothetical protein
MFKLSVDFEFPSRSWWDAGGRELWEGVAEDLDASSVVLDEALAESWLAQARRIPGWDAGPEYAPHPIAVSRVEDDEDALA